MNILITGARGYLGSLLSASLAKQHQVVLTSHTAEKMSGVATLNVTDRSSVFDQIVSAKPNIIIHAAAIANLSKCEAEPEFAISVNATGTLNVVQAANEVGARVIFISSLAACNPNLVYGRSKLIAEEYIHTTDAGFEILRLSMAFGLSPNTSSHRPFNKILDSALSDTPQIFDNSWRFQPTYTEHLIDVVDTLLSQPFQGRQLTVTVDKDCTMYELACDLLGSSLAHPGSLYAGREDIRVDPLNLIKHGLPLMTYDEMLQKIRNQLLGYQARTIARRALE
ncbi:sugar nucleotide-binding protein [Zoogloea sp.]|uniref:sugar nucleotide-binding protein n=1 Tax=Zoogloea sp. TaxID=49181 RepID=UPI0035AF53AB